MVVRPARALGTLPPCARRVQPSPRTRSATTDGKSGVHCVAGHEVRADEARRVRAHCDAGTRCGVFGTNCGATFQCDCCARWESAKISEHRFRAFVWQAMDDAFVQEANWVVAQLADALFSIYARISRSLSANCAAVKASGCVLLQHGPLAITRLKRGFVLALTDFKPELSGAP